MHTEEEARKLWCPLVRFTPIINSGIIIPGSRKKSEDGKIDDYCIASECMMWRWSEFDVEYSDKPDSFNFWDGQKKQYWRWVKGSKTVGFCGLGGKP